MNTATNKTATRSFPMIAGLLLGFLILAVVAIHVRAARSDIYHLDKKCRDEASAFRSEADNLATGSKLVGYTSHYNQQRHQCVVDITSSRFENGGMYSREQIFDPNDGTFIASCDRLSGSSQTSAIVLGAPVPIQRESAALSWFNDLISK